MAATLLVALLIAPATGLAQDDSPAGSAPAAIDPLTIPRPSLSAHRVSVPITIDGILDEAAWAEADSTREDFIQIQPDPGAPASERTVVRILYDDENLYVGAQLYDSEPDKLIVPGLEQDFQSPSSDLFGIALDTYWDRSNGFLFGTNPAGAIMDAQANNDQRDLLLAWEGIVEVRTTVHERGWTAEIRIPFTTLRYTPTDDEQTWGLNFSRRVRRKNEDSNWAPLPRQFRLYKFSMAGTLTGLRGLRKNRNIWVKPYALGSATDGTDIVDGGTNGEVGLDVKWGVTPRLTMDLTANTDFSQVEVDQEQVNLTRFNLFFPEKRDFFLENEATFAFEDVAIRNYRTGSTPRSFKLFHSRRIGLSADRSPVPILAGARLSGRAGPLEVGFLSMQTRRLLSGDVDAPDLPAENFTVGRVRGSLAEGKTVGAMFINRQATSSGSDAWHRSYGVDAHMSFGNLVASAYGARTDANDGSGDRNAAMAQLAWRDPTWNASVLFKHVGDGFDPDVGFVDRRGVRRYFGTVGAHPRPDLPHILEINPYVDVDFFTQLDGTLESRNVTPGVMFVFRDGGSLILEWQDLFERVEEPFSIAGVDVPVGRYDFVEKALRYTAAGSRVLSGTITIRDGGFFDGTRTSVTGNVVLRPNEHWRVTWGFQRNDLELGGEKFTANLFSGRLGYSHDTRTFLSAFVQYNEATEELVTNARFNLIHAPLSDVFLVYTERRSLASGVDEPVLQRGVTFKVTRLVAF